MFAADLFYRELIMEVVVVGLFDCDLNYDIQRSNIKHFYTNSEYLIKGILSVHAR